MKSNMLLVIFVGLIAKLTLVTGDKDENNFDWNKVGFSVLTRNVNQAAFKSLDWFYISFLVLLTNSQ